MTEGALYTDSFWSGTEGKELKSRLGRSGGAAWGVGCGVGPEVTKKGVGCGVGPEVTKKGAGCGVGSGVTKKGVGCGVEKGAALSAGT